MKDFRLENVVDAIGDVGLASAGKVSKKEVNTGTEEKESNIEENWEGFGRNVSGEVGIVRDEVGEVERLRIS